MVHNSLTDIFLVSWFLVRELAAMRPFILPYEGTRSHEHVCETDSHRAFAWSTEACFCMQLKRWPLEWRSELVKPVDAWGSVLRWTRVGHGGSSWSNLQSATLAQPLCKTSVWPLMTNISWTQDRSYSETHRLNRYAVQMGSIQAKQTSQLIELNSLATQEKRLLNMVGWRRAHMIGPTRYGRKTATPCISTTNKRGRQE